MFNIPKYRLSLLASFCLVAAGSMLIAQEIEPAKAEPTKDDPLALAFVRDHSPLDGNDNVAYYGLLNQAREASQAELAEAGRQFLKKRREQSKLLTFPDMIRNPKAFRGQPVHLTGHVLQTIEYDAYENDYGIEKLYESMIYTDDSQTHPAAIVFLEKPDNLPISGDLIEGVTVSGYFLKTYVYPSSDNANRVAPLILAKTVTVKPQPEAIDSGNTNRFIFWGLASGIVILFLVLYIVQRSDRKRMIIEQKKRLDSEAPTFKPPA